MASEDGGKGAYAQGALSEGTAFAIAFQYRFDTASIQFQSLVNPASLQLWVDAQRARPSPTPREEGKGKTEGVYGVNRMDIYTLEL